MQLHSYNTPSLLLLFFFFFFYITFFHFLLSFSNLPLLLAKYFSTFSLEATHLIWLWIMKVKGPKNQPDFMEVPSVLKSGAPKVSQDHLRMKFTYSFIEPRNAPISSLNNAEN